MPVPQTPQTPAFNHKTDVTYTVTAYEPYPAAAPTAYKVGFACTLPRNGRVFPVDVLVPMDQAVGATDDAVVQAALVAIRPQAAAKFAELAAKPSLIGTTVVPV